MEWEGKEQEGKRLALEHVRGDKVRGTGRHEGQGAESDGEAGR